VVLAVLVSAGCVLLCVAVHLGLLLSVYGVIAPRIRTLHRATVGVVVLVAILGHLLEIALFGAGYALLAPAEDGSGFDVLYHSAAAYTSIGDSQPATAEWRVMTAVEALAGLVLITWTASFTFLVMQKNWGHHESVCPLQLPLRRPGADPGWPAEDGRGEPGFTRPTPFVKENP
jgi:Ion channel